MSSHEDALLQVLTRMAKALERQYPSPLHPENLAQANAWIWNGKNSSFEQVNMISSPDLSLLKGINNILHTLHKNTIQFAQGFPANNALLWGARGMGKSSLVKAIFQQVVKDYPDTLSLIEIHRDEISTMAPLMQRLTNYPHRRFILFCDDLSFEQEDAGYKSLKTILDGSIAGRPDNVVFYATSNRRHLLPRDISENDIAIHRSEATEEKVSLSDRFGLWLGFYSCNQEIYLDIIDGYIKYFKLNTKSLDLHAEALEWAITRGSRSGRVAWQFITDLAGRQGKKLT